MAPDARGRAVGNFGTRGATSWPHSPTPASTRRPRTCAARAKGVFSSSVSGSKRTPACDTARETATPRQRQFWIGVVSREHVLRGVAGGFAQLGHGKSAPLKRMRANDGFIYYSPRLSYPDGAPYQRFTAIGIVETGEVYQRDMGGGFVPYRIDVKYR